MKQPARNRESGQRATRDDAGLTNAAGRIAEVGALATAASAMAIGIGQAMEGAERPETGPEGKSAALPMSEHRASHQLDNGDARPLDTVQQVDTRHAAQREADGTGTVATRADDNKTDAGPTPEADIAHNVLDPIELTGRIAEQIASSVRDVLDMAAGGDGSTDTLSRNIVEQARDIAGGIHQQLSAQDPLTALADLLPPIAVTEGLGARIVDAVDSTLDNAGVMDLLAGAAPVVDAGQIVGDVVASLHGDTMPIDVAGIAGEALDTALAIPQSVLGGVDIARNPLAELFYDDGGGEVVQSVADGAGDALTGIAGVASQTLDIGFLGQPLEVGGELGGLTHGHNPLQIL